MAEGLHCIDLSNGVYQLTIDAYPIGSVRKVEGGWRPMHAPDCLCANFKEAALFVAVATASELTRRADRIRDVLLGAVSRGEIVAPKESHADR